jgi:hypothetical protein
VDMPCTIPSCMRKLVFSKSLSITHTLSMLMSPTNSGTTWSIGSLDSVDVYSPVIGKRRQLP